MANQIGIMSFFLSGTVIAFIFICKYFRNSSIFLLVFILAAILHQRSITKRTNTKYSFEEKLINCSKFIFITGVIGVVMITIVGMFYPALTK